ncbi:MAG: hypothetical protein H6Q76_729 [Firmicutes bacterium]|nr:hypothetical protein [Bacillota bacterium]
MISQAEVERLLAVGKVLINPADAEMPNAGNRIALELTSVDGREEFLVDINRPGQIRLSRCAYQNRYRNDIILLRLDVNGRRHTNPDGEVIPCPHLHIYRDGARDYWAVPLDMSRFPRPDDLVGTMVDFLRFCNVTNLNEIRSLQGGVFDGSDTG